MSWRDIAAKVCREVDIMMPPEATHREVVKALEAAYPFGERAMFPYKVWLEERRLLLRRRFPRMYQAKDNAELRRRVEEIRQATGQTYLFGADLKGQANERETD